MSLKLSKNRQMTHGALLIFTFLGCGLTYLYTPNSSGLEILSIGTGYVALLLLFLTLIIGPLNLLRKRRNPVNIDFRRDVGIWAGIDGVFHGLCSLLLADPLSYFLSKESNGYSVPQANLTFLSNYSGLIASIILIVLLVTSNQLSLRWLKGKRWKFVQRWNYPLIAVVLVHTFGYQVLNMREGFFGYALLGLSLLTGAAQLGGVITTLRRTKKRQSEVGSPVPVAPTVSPAMARRRFIAMAGTVVLGSFAGGVVAGQVFNSISGSAQAASQPTQTALQNTPAAANSGNSNTAVSSGNSSTSNSPTASTATSTGNASQSSRTSGQVASTPTATATPSTATTSGSQSSAASAAAGTGVTVLATTVSLAPGNALKFTTPDTKESAILVRQKDGTVKAYSSICTHRPYELVYSSSQEALVCNLHNVPFQCSNGAPTRRPANTALKSFQVKIEGNNIVYSS